MKITTAEFNAIYRRAAGDIRSDAATDELNRLAKARTASNAGEGKAQAAIVAPGVTEKTGKHNAIILDARLRQDWPGVATLIQSWPKPERFKGRGGYCSETEIRFLLEQLEPLAAMGKVVAWAYEMLQFRSDSAGQLTPDFVVVYEGQLELWEVKGAHIWPQDSKRLKAHPGAWRYSDGCPHLRIWQWKGGSWSMERVGW